MSTDKRPDLSPDFLKPTPIFSFPFVAFLAGVLVCGITLIALRPKIIRTEATQPAVTAAGKPITLSPLESQFIIELRNKDTEQIRMRRHSDGSWGARSVQRTPAARVFGEDGIVIEDQE
jgi:hypothetical protein